jgi:ribosomal protein S18 acetylase RimI-like enzyme
LIPVTIIDSDTAARTAGPDDRAEVDRILAAAFLDDPVFVWLTPDRAERRRLLPDMFDVFTEAFARHEATRLVTGGTSNGVAGVAMWAPPGVEPVHPDDEERMSRRLADLAGVDLERLGICLEAFGEAHPEEPAWFLQFVGVDPAHQSEGLGSRLLRDVLDLADRNGEAAYLEATSEANRRLYERHGFRWVADLRLPGGPTAYAMWRDPAGS